MPWVLNMCTQIGLKVNGIVGWNYSIESCSIRTYSEISKEMLSLHIGFGLVVFCLFDARVPEFVTHALPPPPQQLCSVQCALYTDHCVKFWGSSSELAEYMKPKIQWRHIFADLTIPHLWYVQYLRISGIVWTEILYISNLLFTSKNFFSVLLVLYG